MRSILPLFVLLIFISSAVAQEDGETPNRRGSRIIDDTTKQIYGPKTSKYFFEEDVFLNKQTFHFIDTAIRGFHRYNYVQKYNNLYQDLGNIGTAIAPIYYQAPGYIGASSGFQQYDLYWSAERIRHFDTKSPYSNMSIILGGKGRSVTRATFSRNITPRWNFGFDYRGLFIDKQIQRNGKGDRNIRSTYYDLFTNFQSKDSTYRLFFDFRRNKVEADEYGGIFAPEDQPYEDYFFVNAQPSLTQASGKEIRMNIHLFHQYEIGRALQVYHKFDRYRQGNGFKDIRDQNPDSEYYDFVVVDSAETRDEVKFKAIRNELGIKGNVSRLFYNAYYAIRDYSMEYDYIDEDTLRVPASGVENYLGGRISLRLDSLVEVTGWAEVLQTGNYRIEGHITSKWFEATVRQVQYAPSSLQQAYRGSHDFWGNTFSDINVTQVNGAIHYRSKILNVSPGVTFTRLGNYVFFKEDDFDQEQTVLPVQTSGEQVLVAPELKMSVTMARHIFLRGQAIFTKALSNTSNAFQIPNLFVNGELSYENIFFNGNMDMHGGVDVHWHSAYYAMGYDVPIQQFYTQTAYKTPDFPIVDVFFSMRVKRARIFFKYNNLVQAFTKQGYMPTPYYPGQRNVLDFGFDWSFYD
ncbi:MAG TPA: putative porin [Ohtaekwangia sp.]